MTPDEMFGLLILIFAVLWLVVLGIDLTDDDDRR